MGKINSKWRYPVCETVAWFNFIQMHLKKAFFTSTFAFFKFNTKIKCLKIIK